jgi:hypothetical protein
MSHGPSPEPVKKNHETLRTTAIVIIVLIVVFLCFWFGTGNGTPGAASAPTSVCPVPSATQVGHVSDPIPQNSPNKEGKGDPNEGDFTWSCAGLLYRWHAGRHINSQAYPIGSHWVAYPSPTRQWCHFRNFHGHTEIHMLHPGSTCAGGRRLSTRQVITISGASASFIIDVPACETWYKPLDCRYSQHN